MTARDATRDEWAPEGWLSVADVARGLGVGRRLVYRLINDGDLDAYRVGRLIRIPVEAAQRFLAARRLRPGDLEHLTGPDRPDRQRGEQ